MKPLLRRLLLWVALPGLLVVLAVWSWTPREPSWEGRSLSEWLEYSEEPKTEGLVVTTPAINIDASNRAIRSMGTNCLPFLLQRLRNLTPTPSERIVIMLEEQLEKHSVHIPWDLIGVRMSRRYGRVLSAFEALGHQAAPAVPELQRWLCSTNAGIADTAAHVLGYIHPEGTSALITASTNPAVPDKVSVLLRLRSLASQHPEVVEAFLIKAGDPDPKVRALVRGILFPISPEESAILLPVVIRLLADPVSSVRSETVRSKVLNALDEFKGDLRPAVPALKALTTDRDPEIRSQAKALLDKIKASSPTPPPASPAPPP